MSDSRNDGQEPDGSTEVSEEQKRKTELMGDGTPGDASSGDAEADTASGGAPE